MAIYDDPYARFIADWSLLYDENQFLAEKQERIRPDLAILIKFYRCHGRFPERHDIISEAAIAHILEQLEMTESDWEFPHKRTLQRRIEEVKSFLKLTKFDETTHGHRLNEFLQGQPDSIQLDFNEIETNIQSWCLSNGVERPGDKFVTRYFNSFGKKYEALQCQELYTDISPGTRSKLLNSMSGAGGVLSIHDIRMDPGKVGVNTFKQVFEQLRFILSLNLPSQKIADLSPVWLTKVERRMNRQDPSDLRRSSDVKQVGLYAAYLFRREIQITDSLIDALINAVHKIRTNAENRMKVDLGNNIKSVYDNEKLLKMILRESIVRPNAKVKDVIFPIISAPDAMLIVNQKRGKMDVSTEKFGRMHQSWKSHYRSILRDILSAIQFRSNNISYRPIIDALNWISVNFDRRTRIIYGRDDIPIEGVIPNKWRSAVIGSDNTIDKYSYELCTILELREKLRSREIWVRNSKKYRDPDADIPKDFAEKRLEHFKLLGLEQSSSQFIKSVRHELEVQLLALNAELPANQYVNVEWSAQPKFSISKLKPQKEPQNLVLANRQIGERWPMTPLLDMVKETDIDTNFTKCFKTFSHHQNLASSTLKQRLLLTLFALGTNTGLKRIAGATDVATYRQLLHAKKRYIDSDAIREANQIISNAILSVRDPKIWGANGTACAADSQHFKVWDNNPLSEYHVRYKGWGIMIYWHVENKSMCMYSQMKKVTESEVGSMIKGVLNHCTNSDVKRVSVDTHGQTEVGFAFSRLLGFDLAPRIKSIAKSKLYVPSDGAGFALKNLTPILTRPIEWSHIDQQYDEMAKYASAMKTGLADPETILRRFTRTGVMHPTYKALVELGRAIKTIFICRYLRSKTLRREIQESLNVVENWNSATKFVHFGRGGEISSNKKEDQEMAVQALHLVQNCMVYVNTHMYQEVLSAPEWEGKFTAEDFRGITPLIYKNVNPYGYFDLNMNGRIFS